MHSLLVASSSALAAHRKLLGARAARSPTTARRKLLGSRACALAHHSSSQAPRRSRLRARPSRLVASSSVRLGPCRREVGPLAPRGIFLFFWFLVCRLRVCRWCMRSSLSPRGAFSLSPRQVCALCESDLGGRGSHSCGGGGSSSTCGPIGHRGCRPGRSNASSRGGHGTRVPWGIYCRCVVACAFALFWYRLCSFGLLCALFWLLGFARRGHPLCAHYRLLGAVHWTDTHTIAICMPK